MSSSPAQTPPAYTYDKNTPKYMKLRHFLSVAAFPALLLAAASCSTPKDIAYFQDVTHGEMIQPLERNDIKVRPEDKLSIVVSTQDPALSSMFNLVTTQNRIGSSGSGGTLGGSSSGGSGQTSLYTVDPDGDINFPVLGRLHVAGMNRTQLSKYIESEIKSRELVKDPIVTVDYANTGISVLGEVKSPGRVEFNKDHLTIVEAIALAGDVAPDGMRQNVTVMREGENGRQTVYKVDLTDMKQLAQSPVYYMQQNDVIYVEPNDKAKRNTTPNGNSPFTPAFWFSIASFAMTIGTLVISLTK